MAGRGLRYAPFVEHRLGDAFELGILVGRADVACKLEPVAVGIEEIDRAEDAVIGRAENGDALRLDMRLGPLQRIEIGDLEREMLDPFGVFGSRPIAG